MNCPHCGKNITALTGLLELQKYTKHLRSCGKNPKRVIGVNWKGRVVVVKSQNMMEALEERSESGQ